MSGFDRVSAVALRSRALRRLPAAPPPEPGTVRQGHDTRVLSHGGRRPRSVLLLHGYTHMPAQLDPLAERFFARRYNVYVPPRPATA
ncbi:hypothetical protein [Dactylosporangium sp. CA-092794]|uniref:hypothetical protein n=1 Tax=Dactylosporangium sp. CA-092794 TaxID=3239929 RepID=UPI003D9289D4